MLAEYQPYIATRLIERHSGGTALFEIPATPIPSGTPVYTAWRLLQLAALSAGPYVDQPQRFRALADEWRRETAHLSSVAQIVTHPAYQRIIGLGPSAIPLILADLRARGGHWYWALRALTGSWPVPDDAAGDIPRMRGAWLQWGIDQGHLNLA